MTPPVAGEGAWLWSRRVDLIAFVGTALIALALVPLGPLLGVSHSGTEPEWTWIVAVLMVDVAHVWSTAFIVYLDPVEFRRKRAFYLAVPIASWIAGIALYQFGEARFWRAVAYLAIFHFVRQQWGWVAMYRARGDERSKLGRAIDAAAIYAATLYPLLIWHTQVPRAFWWMRDGDIARIPERFARGAGAVYAILLTAYGVAAVVAAYRRRQQRVPGPATNWPKHAVVGTTAACWYVGIVATNSDYAFTVTNVGIHGIPYLVLVFYYCRSAAAEAPHSLGARVIARGFLAFVATLWAVAYCEELLWDRAVWHDRPWLFGEATPTSAIAQALLVPALAVPQLAHYIFDGFLWRRSHNPRLPRLVGAMRSSRSVMAGNRGKPA